MFEDIDEIDFLEKVQADSNAVLLDVRTVEEWDTGYIAGAQRLDFYHQDFQAQLEKFDKTKNYYVYCRSGNRSGKACEIMAEAGFSGEIFNLQGGIMGWTGDLEF